MVPPVNRLDAAKRRLFTVAGCIRPDIIAAFVVRLPTGAPHRQGRAEGCVVAHCSRISSSLCPIFNLLLGQFVYKRPCSSQARHSGVSIPTTFSSYSASSAADSTSRQRPLVPRKKKVLAPPCQNTGSSQKRRAYVNRQHGHVRSDAPTAGSLTLACTSRHNAESSTPVESTPLEWRLPYQ